MKTIVDNGCHVQEKMNEMYKSQLKMMVDLLKEMKQEKAAVLSPAPATPTSQLDINSILLAALSNGAAIPTSQPAVSHMGLKAAEAQASSSEEAELFNEFLQFQKFARK